MCGSALELKPDFSEKAPAILLTQRAACVPDVMEKLEAYVREGGKAIVTVGFLHETYHRGIQDMTSVRLTHRHVLGDQYMIDLCDFDYAAIRYARGAEKAMFEVLDYKTNATWADILVSGAEDNFPVLTEDFYGRGRLLILNVPENFADLYRLPAEVIGAINRELSFGQPFYLISEPKVSLIAYDNETCCLHSFCPMKSTARLVVRGQSRGVLDLESGKTYADSLPLPAPHHRNDGAKTRLCDPEYAYEIPLLPGKSLYLKILR